MKKILIVLIIATVSLSASAQKRYYGRGYTNSHVIVTYGSPYYYYPRSYLYYDPFYYPYYPYGYYPGETRLNIKIDQLRSEYQNKIWSARHDKSLSKPKRKELVHQLKYERDMAINKAKEDYYKPR